MSTEEKPLSELISSIEQKDFTPTERVKEEKVTSPKEKGSKAFVIIVSILLLLIVGIGGYYIYTNYIVKEKQTQDEELTQEEQVPQFEEIFIDFEDSSRLYVKLPTSGCNDLGYVLQEQEDLEISTWWEQQEGECLSLYNLTYYKSEEVMIAYYSNNEATFPLEKFLKEGAEYEVISLEESSDQNQTSGSIMIKREPTTTVGSYEASEIEIISTEYNSENVTDTTIETKVHCAFNLNKISNMLTGYIVFSGNQNQNYCNVLDSTEYFEIRFDE